MFMRILFWLDTEQFKDYLEDVSSKGLLQQCNLGSLVIISEVVKKKDQTVYALILRRIVLKAMQIGQLQDNTNIISNSIKIKLLNISLCFLWAYQIQYFFR